MMSFEGETLVKLAQLCYKEAFSGVFMAHDSLKDRLKFQLKLSHVAEAFSGEAKRIVNRLYLACVFMVLAYAVVSILATWYSPNPPFAMHGLTILITGLTALLFCRASWELSCALVVALKKVCLATLERIKEVFAGISVSVTVSFPEDANEDKDDEEEKK